MAETDQEKIARLRERLVRLRQEYDAISDNGASQEDLNGISRMIWEVADRLEALGVFDA